LARNGQSPCAMKGTLRPKLSVLNLVMNKFTFF
jgi:hypothetical protein